MPRRTAMVSGKPENMRTSPPIGEIKTTGTQSLVPPERKSLLSSLALSGGGGRAPFVPLCVPYVFVCVGVVFPVGTLDRHLHVL